MLTMVEMRTVEGLLVTSGMVVKMGTGAISWASKLQPFVTLSTTEAEYIAAVSARQEILWLRPRLVRVAAWS